MVLLFISKLFLLNGISINYFDCFKDLMLQNQTWLKPSLISFNRTVVPLGAGEFVIIPSQMSLHLQSTLKFPNFTCKLNKKDIY
jgi:hypothetical protein